MKLIYTHENRLLVNNIRNIVENAGIAVVLKNEFAGGGMGELSPFDTWLELWVLEDADFEKAQKIVDTETEPCGLQEWQCSQCFEMNSDSFEICWQCQQPRIIAESQ